MVDTSALVAMLLNEPECDSFALRIGQAQNRYVSAVSMLEASMVAHGRLGSQGAHALDALITGAELELVPFDDVQRRLAVEAFSRYGKGIDAKARLNLGDCAGYALAKHLNAPLLFKGSDFAATDIVAAV